MKTATESLREELLSLLSARLTTLPDKPAETPEATLRALWCAAAGEPMSIERARACELPSLDASQVAALRTMLERRLRGEPLAHLTGRQSFMGLELLAGPEALVPRVETELLARVALEAIREMAAHRGGECEVVAVDVCTGAGNVALALAHYEPRCRVLAADLSPQAVCLARKNAAQTGLDAAVSFATGDLLEPFAPQWFGRIDLITCNPPYIASAHVGRMPAEIAAHEPRLAFDGGPLGVAILTRLLATAPSFLRPGGVLCVEVGAGQAEAIRRRAARNSAWSDVAHYDDQNGIPRVVCARRHSKETHDPERTA